MRFAFIMVIDDFHPEVRIALYERGSFNCEVMRPLSAISAEHSVSRFVILQPGIKREPSGSKPASLFGRDSFVWSLGCAGLRRLRQDGGEYSARRQVQRTGLIIDAPLRAARGARFHTLPTEKERICLLFDLDLFLFQLCP